MIGDIGAGGTSSTLQTTMQPTKDELIGIARKAIDNAHNEIRSTADSGLGVDTQQQPQPGVTVDLCHKKIIILPEEVIDIIKDEIERLAISHNALSGFSAKLAECKRLRYLNGRYNNLREIPSPVLELPSLEILDLSRNRIRNLPDGLQNMTSLKVLALQRNQIERLPTVLGSMTTLRVLKVNENPLVFPPKHICAPDDDQTGVGRGGSHGDKAMIAVTQRIKRYLRDYAGSTPKARSFVDSDGETSESNAETPRPFRPMGTRFPVRPSLGGTDTMIIPTTKTSQDPPPIPSKSHERMRSNQLPVSRKNTLLSPPEPNMTHLNNTFGQSGSEVTVRPKRHGMITPRGPEGAAQQMALSPSALQEAFSGFGSRPASRAGSARSTSSLTSDNIDATARIVHNVVGDLYRRLFPLQALIELQHKSHFKIGLEAELRAASLRADALQKAVSRSPIDKTGTPQRHVFKPLVDCLVSISNLSRLTVQITPLYFKTASPESFRQTFWNTQRDTWELYVANSLMGDMLASVTHSRQISTSSRYGRSLKRFDSDSLSLLSGLAPSPTGSSFLTATAMANSNSSPHAMLASVPAPLSIQPKPTVSFEVDNANRSTVNGPTRAGPNDELWERMRATLHEMSEVTVENLSKIKIHYQNERQKALHHVDQGQELAKRLGSLLQHCNVTIDAANSLGRQLENTNVNDQDMRHSLDFWAHTRTIFMEWYIVARQFKGLPGTANPEIKNLMRPIHVAIKRASVQVQESPWAAYMQKTNYATASENQLRGPLRNMNINTQQLNGNSSVPSTPLSAALGPAAAAALPSSKAGNSRPSINFFERADRYANATNQRQAEIIYGKRGGA